MNCATCNEQIEAFYTSVGYKTYQWIHTFTRSPFCGHPPIAKPEVVVPEKCNCPNCTFIQDIVSGAKP